MTIPDKSQLTDATLEELALFWERFYRREADWSCQQENCRQALRTAAALRTIPKLREAIGQAAFVLWGCGEHKIEAAEERFAELFKELKIEW